MAVQGGEQFIASAREQVAKMAIHGARLAGKWISFDGGHYVLRVIGLESFSRQAAKASQIDEKMRHTLVELAERGICPGRR